MSMQRLATTAALALTLASAAQAASSLNRSHGVYAETQHCCWDVRYNIVSNSGTAASYSVASWSAQASFNGSLAYGQIEGTATTASDITNYVYANAVAEGRDYWVETFHIQSATLAAGTPVALSLGVWLDASVNTSTVGQGYALAVIGTGLDAGWLAGVDTRSVGSGAHSATTVFNTGVGASITLVGQLNTRAWSELSNGPTKTATASSTATARFTVDSLTDGAFYTSSSGTGYATPSSPVPEPATWALLLGGAALLPLAVRRQRSRRPS